MKAQLYCRAREGVTLTFDVGTSDADIGRDGAAPVSVSVEGVSRRHARVSWDGKAHWLEDLKSTNGTFLNGEVVQRERLRHLDVITLGRAVNLIYVLRGEDYAPVKKQGIVAARLVPLAQEAVPYSLPVGETTLGRSEVCNVIAESGAVSKIHARIERGTSKLTIEDLGSSNGTTVNDERLQALSTLHDGDEIRLAGAERFRIEIQMGEIAAPSGTLTDLPTPKLEKEDEPAFSSEWKTRVEWSTSEMLRLQAVREEALDGTVMARPSSPEKPPEAAGKAPRPTRRAPPAKPDAVKPAAPKAKATPAAQAPARPEAPSRPAPPAKGPEEPAAAAAPAARPAAPPPSKPAPFPPTPPRPMEAAASRPPAAPQVEAPPAPAPSPSPPAAKPPSPAPPEPERPPARAASDAPPAPATPTPPRPEAASPPADTTAAVSGIVAVRLVASTFDLVVSIPGEHRIGRAAEAPLRIEHPTVSRKHARLILSDDRQKAFIQHDGGGNGTFHNGKRIQRIEELSDGDVLEIGEVSLRVRIETRR